MSALIEVVERIACCAEQQKFVNCVEATKAEAIRQNQLYSPPISEPPRLSIQQIVDITRDYPLNLTTEVFELYQMGNGCLPIGSDSGKDWNSLENYFMFPNPYYAQLLPLRSAMNYYQYDIEEPISYYRDINPDSYYRDINPGLFPIIVGNERRFWAIIGGESQYESSPIFFYFNDYPERTKLAWSNLMNLLLAWVEIKEQQLDDRADQDKIIKIADKYGGVTEGGCEGLELLWYLSFRL